MDRAILGGSRGVTVTLGAAVLALLAFAAPSANAVVVMALSLAFAVMLAAARSIVVPWYRVVALILMVVLFIPIDRYQLPGSLPFNLELYRVVIALCIAAWFVSILADPTVRLTRTTFDGPLALIGVCVLASEITNPGRLSSYDSSVTKALTFFLSFILVYYLTATTLTRRSSVEFLLKLVTVSGAAIGVFAVYERRSHYNVFDHLHSLLPFLRFDGALSYLTLSDGQIRVFGPSQQPIALGAMMILILPLAVYFARASGRKWWIAAVLLLLGAFASGSRTAIVMLTAEVIVFLVLKPRETKKLWPALIPALAIIHFALPGTIGGLKEAFFPKGGIIAQQSRLEPGWNPELAGGRIRQIAPELSEVSSEPLFGEGLGTRISGFSSPNRNAPILDNQWLDNIMDIGFVGFAAYLWLFVRAIRALSRASRTSSREFDDWLFAAFAASFTGFGVGMLTFDAFGFTQITIMFWVLLGLAAVLLRITAAQPALAGQRASRAGARRLRAAGQT